MNFVVVYDGEEGAEIENMQPSSGGGGGTSSSSSSLKRKHEKKPNEEKLAAKAAKEERDQLAHTELMKAIKEVSNRLQNDDEAFLLSLLPSFRRMSEDRKYLLRIELMQTVLKFNQAQHYFNNIGGAFFDRQYGMYSVPVQAPNYRVMRQHPPAHPPSGGSFQQFQQARQQQQQQSTQCHSPPTISVTINPPSPVNNNHQDSITKNE